MEEIEDTGREMLLSLRDGEKSPKELERELEISHETVNKWTGRLNDKGTILSHNVSDDPTARKKYTLNEENVEFKRKTDEFIPDLASFIPSVLITFVLYFLTKNLSLEIFFGVSIGLMFPFFYLIYKIMTVEDYIIVVRKGD